VCLTWAAAYAPAWLVAGTFQLTVIAGMLLAPGRFFKPESGTETLLTTVGNVTTFSDTTVTNGVTYFYKVSAVTAAGEGPLSNELGATASSDLSVSTIPLQRRRPVGEGQRNTMPSQLRKAATSSGRVVSTSNSG